VEDAFGHQISYLRVSVTDRCNERCRYCMPEEEQGWLPQVDALTYAEMQRVIQVAAGLGVTKVRITGGEPLTRPGIAAFCADVAAIPGIRQVAVSTNGTLLTKRVGGVALAQQLYQAGVRGLNVSLDSLNAALYQSTTQRDLLAAVLAGIDAALAAGFQQIRLNCVLMKNQTEAEMLPLIEFAHQKGLLLRFIELMPVSTLAVLSEENFLPVATAKKWLEHHYGGPLRPLPDFRTHGPASYYQLPGREQKIGFIGAMTNLHFCESCDKLRLTSDGKLRPCLGSYLEFDLRQVLRSGCTDAELGQFIHSVVARKPKEHDFRNQYQPNRRMIAIGG
jgi:GTP 3',8-cyclase